MDNIFAKANHYFNQNRPFVLYCKPNSEVLVGFFQKNDTLHTVTNFAEKGFVFSNFSGDTSILFPEEFSDILTERFENSAKFSSNSTLKSATSGQKAFEKLVQKGIQEIQAGQFQKVVLSRKESIEQDKFEFLTVFQKMLALYQATFRYCFFHPEVGMWLGATPEQLLKVENSSFETVALAGTQKWEPNKEPIWKKKEQEEQQFVTDFIISELKEEVDFITKSEPYTFKAGTIVHLKTDISGVFKQDFDLGSVIKVLHPTPAVCGLPKENAKDFILANEGYDRKFYAGFLGELNHNFETNKIGDSDLFVNLRCMEVQQNQVHLYIGCGITKDSDPEKEYVETANKAMTMKRILK